MNPGYAMDRIPLADLEVFAAVARHGSFRRAALERGVTPSLLSQNLRRLEAQLGVVLLKRTTRSVAPSVAGKELFAQLEPALAQIADAVDLLNRYRDMPFGTLRLNAPGPIAHFVLAPLVARFQQAYPDIGVDISADAALTDIVKGGFDAGVRFADNLAQDAVAVPIGPPQRYAVVGSPSYFAAHGRPATPHDLATHRCIRRRFPGGTLFTWHFARDGESASVVPRGPLTVNDAHIALNAALHGAGLAYVHESYVLADVAAGRLERVLADWAPGLGVPYLYYPQQRYVPVPLRSFIDFARQHPMELATP